MPDTKCNECGIVSSHGYNRHAVACSKSSPSAAQAWHAQNQQRNVDAQSMVVGVTAGQLAGINPQALQSAENVRWTHRAYEPKPYTVDSAKHEEVVAKAMRLEAENKELLAENARLRRALERKR